MWMNVLIPTIFALIALLGLCINLLIIITLIFGGFIRRPKVEAVFLISISELIADVIFLLIILIEFIPTCYAQKWIYPHLFHSLFVGIGMSIWFVASLLKASMAINRFIVICMRKYHYSNNRITVALAILPWIIGVALNALSNSLPCCRYVLRYELFSMVVNAPSNDEHVIDYANFLLKLPINILSTMTIIICYACIIVSIERLRRKVSNTAFGIHQKRYTDYRYALQFLLIAITYSFTWISLRIIPALTSSPPILSLQTLLAVINFSTTGSVMFAVNGRVRRKAFQVLRISRTNDTIVILSNQQKRQVINH